MSRRSIRNILAVVVLGVIGVAAWGWWFMAVGRYPLSGAMRHDFGAMPVVEGRASAEHVFRLVNRTGEPVVIEDIRSSCGCTAVSASTTRVEPGASVDVAVTLTLVPQKKTNVSLVIEGFGVQNLWVEGTRGSSAGR